LSGYLKAIERAPQAQSAVDAGTGPAALLAVATKVYHPKAQVWHLIVTKSLLPAQPRL